MMGGVGNLRSFQLILTRVVLRSLLDSLLQLKPLYIGIRAEIVYHCTQGTKISRFSHAPPSVCVTR